MTIYFELIFTPRFVDVLYRCSDQGPRLSPDSVLTLYLHTLRKQVEFTVRIDRHFSFVPRIPLSHTDIQLIYIVSVPPAFSS
jgi:hypothetical protein